jgi:hypothetical protein
MLKHIKCFLVCSLTLLLVSMTARAELYLVLGSYSKAASATSQATHLTELLGVDVTTHATQIEGITYQRVLLRAGSTNNEIDQLLSQQGISPWLFNLNPDAASVSFVDSAERSTQTTSMDSDSQQYFVVAASYTDVERALEEERTLADNFNSVRGQTSLVDGEVQHRVLIGPNYKVTAEKHKAELLSLGYSSAWLLAAAADEYGYLSSSTTSAVSDESNRVSPPIPRPKPRVVEEDKSGFNLATLPEKNPVFTIE